MIRVAVIGDGVLAYAVGRQLASRSTRVVLHRTQRDADCDDGDAAYLRLLNPDPARLAREVAALKAWQGLVRETGVQMMSRVDAVDVGPATTIATTLHETASVGPVRALHPVEAARSWPQIRFDGLVAHQSAARRVHLQIARDALERSALMYGVSIAAGTAIQVRTTGLGGVEVMAGGSWQSYDAVLVIADHVGRSRLVRFPTTAESTCVLQVDSIGPVAGWPSVTHQAGLPPDADGYTLPCCRAELHRGQLELRLEEPPDDYADAVARLWEYAARWLPGTIVSSARVRTDRDAIPMLDTPQRGLGIVAPLPAGDRALAPVVAIDVARGLLQAIAVDFENEGA